MIQSIFCFINWIKNTFEPIPRSGSRLQLTVEHVTMLGSLLVISFVIHGIFYVSDFHFSHLDFMKMNGRKITTLWILFKWSATAVTLLRECVRACVRNFQHNSLKCCCVNSLPAPQASIVRKDKRTVDRIILRHF